MELLVAPVEHITFDIEVALAQQLGAQPLPFPGMDKSGAAVCEFYVRSTCQRGAACPFRHVRGDKTIVCKHWLRGLCKKGKDNNPKYNHHLLDFTLQVTSASSFTSTT